jgi:CubicO group peptidase (beta-lactamase class C family)
MDEMTGDQVAAALLLGVLVSCATGGGRSLPAIDALLAEYTGPTVPGASVIVIQDGRVILRRAYEMADLERHVAATPGGALALGQAHARIWSAPHALDPRFAGARHEIG